MFFGTIPSLFFSGPQYVEEVIISVVYKWEGSSCQLDLCLVGFNYGELERKAQPRKGLQSREVFSRGDPF